MQKTFSVFALITAVFIVAAAGQRAHYRTDGSALLPDPVITPGATVPSISAVRLCRPGYAAAARHLDGARKSMVYREYDARPRPGVCCEVDHLVSLELGGSNAIANLWPQPYTPRPGAHQKDLLEDYLHREVCAGTLPLVIAQQELRQNWVRYWRAMTNHR